MTFIWSDAVILYAVCWYNELGGSDRVSISKAGGYIARCALTDVEYYGGLYRLLSAKHVYLDEHQIFADEAALDHFLSSPPGTDDVFQMTDHMMDFLGISWST